MRYSLSRHGNPTPGVARAYLMYIAIKYELEKTASRECGEMAHGRLGGRGNLHKFLRKQRAGAIEHQLTC